MERNLVSVIIPTYNRSQYLGETLESIIDQTYEQWECLVIDDGSNDETEDLMIGYENKDGRITYRKRPDSFSKGANGSRNYGLTLSKGEFIAFCDDDDYWLPTKLEKQIPVFKDFPKVGLVTSNLEFVASDGIRTGRVIDFSPCNGYIFEALLLKNQTSTITVVVKREVFDKVGLFNTTFRFSEDWEMWRRIGFYYEFYVVPEVLACVRKHELNITNELTNKPLEKFKLYRRLTKSLLKWGDNRFSKEDLKIIQRVEWQHYRTILINNCPGIKPKVSFFLKLMVVNFFESLRFMFLLLKYELLKPNKSVF